MHHFRLSHWLAFCALLAAAAALRLIALGTAPPGLYRDEAYYALDALDVLKGAHPIYFPANNGREPLFIYMLAASLAWFGREPWAVRLPAALLGILTVPGAFALARTWFPRQPGLAWWTAALVAFTFWPLHLSRIGFRVISLPCVAAWALAALGWWWHAGKRAPARAVLVGALLGLLAYTYLAARLIPLALALWVLWLWLTRAPSPPRAEWPLVLGAAALVVAPLALYALSEPVLFLGRPGQVSVFNPEINHGDPLGALMRSVFAALGMFIVRGDTIPRHNLPGRPVFDALIAPFFVLGVAWAVWILWPRARRVGAEAQAAAGVALAGAWLAVMLVPTALAEDAPHFLRAAGLLPVVCLVPAWGLEAVCARLPWRGTRAALVGLCALSALWTGYAYFGEYAALPRVATEFESAAVALARTARAGVASGADVYVAQRYWDTFASVRFLLADTPITRITRPADISAARDTLALVWPYDPTDPLAGYAARLPLGRVITAYSGPLAQGDLEPEPYALYTALTAQAIPTSDAPPLARFVGGPILQAATREIVDGHLRVYLLWRADEKVAADYSVYVHALAHGARVGGVDGPLGGGTWPATAWRPGERVGETYVVDLADVADAPEALVIQVGLYDADGVRLAVQAPLPGAPPDGVIVAP